MVKYNQSINQSINLLINQPISYSWPSVYYLPLCTTLGSSRLLGFRDPPTDYYARPYYLAMGKDARDLKHAPDCRSATPKHRDWLNWVKDIFHMYRDHPKFMMHFYATLSHDDNNKISIVSSGYFM